eukprot:m.25552 g.25552  ORF g.25552 m.25552 type:complete len:1146 (-) comp4447_c0_seq1:85-3522(-)
MATAGGATAPSGAKFRFALLYENERFEVEFATSVTALHIYEVAAKRIKVRTEETINIFYMHDGHKALLEYSAQQIDDIWTPGDDIVELFVEDDNDEESEYNKNATATVTGKRNAITSQGPTAGPANNKMLAITDSATAAASSGTSNYNTYNVQSSTGFVGLANQGATCYLNSLLQTLFMTPEFRDAIYRCPIAPDEFEKKKISKELQALFAQLQTSNARSASTTSITKSFGWDREESFQQHDIQELMRVLFEKLESEWQDSELKDKLKQLFRGQMLDFVMCKECHTKSSRTDDFMDVPLVIRAFGATQPVESVEEAIASFVETEVLEGDNQYNCEKCEKKTDALKGLQFASLPYILTLQLKRFDLDYTTWRRIKLNDSVSFPLVLDLNSVIPSGPEDIEEQALNKLKASGDSASFSPENNEALIKAALENGPNVYELYSVMIHSGSALGGHYYAYIRSFGDNKWYCFNDSSVTEIEETQIKTTFGGVTQSSYSQAYTSSSNAYMLMYRRVDPEHNLALSGKDDIPESVHEIARQIEAQQREAEMERERKLQQATMNVYYGDDEKPPTHKLNVEKNSTMAEVLKLAIEAFGLEKEAAERPFRLRRFNMHRGVALAALAEDELVMNLTRRSPYNSDVILDQAGPDGKFVDLGSDDLFLKIRVLNPETMTFDNSYSISTSSAVTVGEVKCRVAELIKCDPADVRLAVKESWKTRGITDADDQRLQPTYSTVTAIVLHVDASARDGKTFEDSALHEAIEAIRNKFSLKVIFPDQKDDEVTEIEIDQRKTVAELKRDFLAPKLKLSVDEFKLMLDSYSSKELTKMDESIEDAIGRYAKVRIEEGKPLPENGGLVPVWYYDAERFEVGNLFQIVAQSGDSIERIKEIILKEAAKEAEKDESAPSSAQSNANSAQVSPVPDSDKQSESNEPSVLTRVLSGNFALRSIATANAPGRVLTSSYKLTLSVELCVQLNPPGEVLEAEGDSIIYFCRQWSPDTLTFGKTFEVILPNDSTVETLAKIMSERSGIPMSELKLANLPYANRRFPFEMGTFDVEKSLRFLEPTRTKIELSPFYAHTGSCFYFKNKTLEVKEPTEEERKEIEQVFCFCEQALGKCKMGELTRRTQNDRKRCRPPKAKTHATYYRKEKALQIK